MQYSFKKADINHWLLNVPAWMPLFLLKSYTFLLSYNVVLLSKSVMLLSYNVVLLCCNAVLLSYDVGLLSYNVVFGLASIFCVVYSLVFLFCFSRFLSSPLLRFLLASHAPFQPASRSVCHPSKTCPIPMWLTTACKIKTNLDWNVWNRTN